MSLLPVLGDALSSFPRRLRPYNNVTPFTYQDGLTYLEVLESLREWLSEGLIGHLNEEISNLIAEYDAATEALRVEMVRYTALIKADREAFEASMAADRATFAALMQQRQDDFEDTVDEARQRIESAITGIEAAATRAETAEASAERWAAGTEALQAKAIADKATPFNLSRTINRLKAKENLKFSVIGDSIADPSTPGNAAGGPIEKAAALIAARFGVEISVNNQAKSGYTAARAYITGRVQAAIDGTADVVFIVLGKNDIGSDIGGQYAPGYPLKASIASIERMIAAARRDNDKADIVIIGEGPYTAGSSSNPVLRNWSRTASQVAAAWGAQYIDIFPYFEALGDYSGYMYDSTHQNAEGNNVYANAILDYFPSVFAGSAMPPAPYGRGVYDVSRVNMLASLNYGYGVNAGASGVTSGGLLITESGSGWAAQATSTPGDYIELSGKGIEFHLQVDTSVENAAVVDLSIDGVVKVANLKLAEQGKNGIYLIAFALDLTPSNHTVRLTLKSGKLYRAAGAILQPGNSPYTPETRVIDYGTSTDTPAIPTDGNYVEFITGQALQLPVGWGAMTVQFQAEVSYRYIGPTGATTRDVQTQIQLGATVVAASRYTFPAAVGSAYYPQVVDKTLAVTTPNAQGLLFRARLLSTDKTAVTATGTPSWSFRAILTRTA